MALRRRRRRAPWHTRLCTPHSKRPGSYNPHLCTPHCCKPAWHSLRFTLLHPAPGASASPLTTGLRRRGEGGAPPPHLQTAHLHICTTHLAALHLCTSAPLHLCTFTRRPDPRLAAAVAQPAARCLLQAASDEADEDDAEEELDPALEQEAGGGGSGVSGASGFAGVAASGFAACDETPPGDRSEIPPGWIERSRR